MVVSGEVGVCCGTHGKGACAVIGENPLYGVHCDRGSP